MQCDINHKVVKKVQKTISRYQLLPSGSRVLVGISGGADSVCLLHILYSLAEEMKLKIYAAHLHHGIRGKEADKDVAFVQNLCQKWQIPLFMQKTDVPMLAQEEKVSLETAGRLARYRFFHQVCEEQKLDVIATAHNQNDQAETMLMRILRGTGIDGLSGIRFQRVDGVVRPLLDVSRSEIEQYCSDMSLKYCLDSTNGENSYTRNRIRNVLIPMLEEQFNPRISETLSRMAQNMAEDGDFLDHYAQRLYRRINHPKPKARPIVLDIASLGMVEPSIKTRLIRIAAKEAMGTDYYLEHRHIEAIKALLDKETGACTELPNGLTVAVRYGWLAFETPQEINKQQAQKECCGEIQYEAETGKIFDFPEYAVTLKMGVPGEKLRKNEMILDYDKIKNFTLTVRNRRRGDRIAVYRDGKMRKLKDFMIDLKIPVWKRGNIPLLCSDNSVLAVVGYRIAEPYKIDENSKRGLVISYDTINAGW